MDVAIDISKSLEANAEEYFSKAKKARKKMEGAREAIARFKSQRENIEEKGKLQVERAQQVKKKVKRKKMWFEKFRWFRSSEGFLVIGGRDATSNEIIVKKHTDPGDIVFHTDMAGSPFFVVKAEGRDIPEMTIEEVANATVSFSRARKLGLQTSQVFWVRPDQLSKTPRAGEFVGRGAFIVRGKTNYVDNRLDVAIGLTEDGLVMAGPLRAVRKHCEKFVIVELGRLKATEAAKKIQKVIGGTIDEIVRVLPPGEYEVKKAQS